MRADCEMFKGAIGQTVGPGGQQGRAAVDDLAESLA